MLDGLDLGEIDGAAPGDHVDEQPPDGAATRPSGATPSPEEAAPPQAPAPDLPELDHNGVVARDVEPVDGADATDAKPGRPRARRARTNGRGSASTDWARLESERRVYGSRGEHVVYEQERSRLSALGMDPDLVRWVAREQETAPYDIESLEREGQPRYIEVKSTTGADPSDPFVISSAELQFALHHRERYYIYRVTAVGDAAPEVHRYLDPLGELECQRASLRMSRGLMTLPPGLDPVDQ
jgi:hypothetical protein